MGEGVLVPLWLLVVVAVLAAWTIWSRLLVPALRWFVAGRTEHVLEEVSSRLKIGVRPFQRTQRQALIHRLLAEPKVQAAAERHAAEHKLPLPAVLAQVEGYAREIAFSTDSRCGARTPS